MALGRLSGFRQLDERSPSSPISAAELGGPFAKLASDADTTPAYTPGTIGLGTPVGNPNVTGYHGGLVNLGANFASLPAGGIPGIPAGLLGQGLGPAIATAITNFGLSRGRAEALNAVPTSLVSQDPDTLGSAVSYSGPTSLSGLIGSLVGTLTGGRFGSAAPSFTAARSDPFGLANQATAELPFVSPNMGNLFSGNSGFVPSGTGDLSAGFTGSGAGGRFGWNAPGVKNPFAPYFTDPRPPTPPTGEAPTSDVPADTSPNAGVPPDTGQVSNSGVVSSDGNTGVGLGESGGDAWHRGGFVGLEEDWGHTMTNRLNQQAGRPKEVPARLEPGEYVVNKEATKQARPVLDAINSLGRYLKDNGGNIAEDLLRGALPLLLK